MNRQLRLLSNSLSSATAPLARQLLEAVTCTIIVLTLIGIGATTMYRSVANTQVSEAFTLLKSPMIEVIIQNAERGTWPEAQPPGELETDATESEQRPQVLGKYVERIVHEGDGDMTVLFRDSTHALIRGQHVTIRPILKGDGAVVLWRLAPSSETPEPALDPNLTPHAWRLTQEEP